jgi:ParB-like chromosome segregation protein Spo0J
MRPTPVKTADRLMISEIYLAGSRRPADLDKVRELARSIDEIGLQNPVIIRSVDHYVDPTDGELDGAYLLVSGRHRLEAQKLRGETHIDCFVVDYDDLHAELAEIDENLIRCNLTPAQEGKAIARRKAIYEELHPETKAGTAGANARWGEGNANEKSAFASSTADATGKGRRSIEIAAARGEALGEENLDAITGTSLDKGVELDALAKMPEGDRKVLIGRAKAGEDVSARAPSIDGDIRNRAAQELAEWIVSHANGNDLDAVKANLFAAGAKNIAVELTNLIGQSIMDRRFA